MAIISGIQTLKLSPSLYKPQSFLFPIKTLTLIPSLKPRSPSLCRAFSPPAVQIADPSVKEEKGGTFAKPQWRAAIDFKWIRENRDLVAANIKNRNSTANLELVLEIYDKFLNLQKEVERLRGERNVVANKMKGKLEQSVRQALIEEGKNLKEQLVSLEEELAELTDMLQLEGQSIPNITHPDVPVGGEDNSALRKMVQSWGHSVSP